MHLIRKQTHTQTQKHFFHARSVTDLCLLVLCLVSNLVLWQHIIPLLSPQQPQTQIRCWVKLIFWARIAVEHSVIRRTTMACKVEMLVPPDSVLKSETFAPLFGFPSTQERWNVAGTDQDFVSSKVSKNQVNVSKHIMSQDSWDLTFSKTSHWTQEILHSELNVVINVYVFQSNLCMAVEYIWMCVSAAGTPTPWRVQAFVCTFSF